MVNDNGQPLEIDIKRLVEETKALSQENYRLLKKLHRHMLLDQFMSVVKIILIVVPMIAAYYYLAPMFKGLIGTYSDLLNLKGGIQGLSGSSAVSESGSNSDILKNISPDVIKQLQESGALDQYLQQLGR